MLELNEEQSRHKAMIDEVASKHGMKIQGDEWFINEAEANRIAARLGKWHVPEDNESMGLFAGDEGQLTAVVVGGIEYGNERVSFSFLNAEYSSDEAGEEVVPFEDVHPV